MKWFPHTKKEGRFVVPGDVLVGAGSMTEVQDQGWNEAWLVISVVLVPGECPWMLLLCMCGREPGRGIVEYWVEVEPLHVLA